MTVKVSSSVGSAQDAVSGFAGLGDEVAGEEVTVASSNLGGMLQGASAANQVLSEINAVVETAKQQADLVSALATTIEQRDREDSSSMGSAR